MKSDRRERIRYAFGHMVASYGLDAHAGDSGELADDVLLELGLTPEVIGIVEVIAEHVAGNYTYTGATDDFSRRVAAGEV